MEQQLVLAKLPMNEQLDLSAHLGIIMPLKFPFNLFLNLSNLTDPDMNLVYFFIYALGQKKIVMWGVYDKTTQEFHIDGECRYNTQQISTIVGNWRKNQYQYTSNTVEDKIDQTMKKYLSDDTKHITYSQYKFYKTILGYYRDLISEEELLVMYPAALDEFYEEASKYLRIPVTNQNFELALFDYLDVISEQVKNFESKINRIDYDRDVMRSVAANVAESIHKITQRFYDTLKYGLLNSNEFYNQLDTCPNLGECVNATRGNNCEVYFYGNGDLGYLSPRDRRLLV